MPVMFRTALPEFVKVITCAVLVVLTCWLANVKLVAERLAVGVVPPPPPPAKVTIAPVQVDEGQVALAL